MMAPHNHNSVSRFHALLRKSPSPRILAVCGAGLSAASGLPTFRGAGGLWRNHAAERLATPTAFQADPGLVWLFYGYRRHMALNVQPNAGHYALAALARKSQDFLCVSQNVDNLCQRAHHPPAQLKTIHGSLFDVRCANTKCDYIEVNNMRDPLWPVLAPASVDVPPNETLPLLDPSSPAPDIKTSDIPRCPKCTHPRNLLRPGVVWFNEMLDPAMLDEIDTWITEGVDIVLIIGTANQVSTSINIIEQAQLAGAVLVHINIDAETPSNLRQIEEGDFAFGGSATDLLPVLLEPIIGKMREDGTFT